MSSPSTPRHHRINLPILRHKDNARIRSILLHLPLQHPRPQALHAQSLLLEDRVHWLGALRGLSSADPGVKMIHLNADSGRVSLWLGNGVGFHPRVG